MNEKISPQLKALHDVGACPPGCKLCAAASAIRETWDREIHAANEHATREFAQLATGLYPTKPPGEVRGLAEFVPHSDPTSASIEAGAAARTRALLLRERLALMLSCNIDPQAIENAVRKLKEKAAEVEAAWQHLDHAVDGQPYWTEPDLADTKLSEAITVVLDHYRGEIERAKAVAKKFTECAVK